MVSWNLCGLEYAHRHSRDLRLRHLRGIERLPVTHHLLLPPVSRFAIRLDIRRTRVHRTRHVRLRLVADGCSYGNRTRDVNRAVRVELARVLGIHAECGCEQ